MKAHPGTPRAAGLALLLTLACSDAVGPEEVPAAASEGRLAVIQRVAAAAGRAAQPLKLETYTRDAIALPVGESFDVPVDGPLRAIHFSIAARAAAAVGFAIQARTGDRWVRVFDAELEAGEPRWRDQRLEPAQLPGEVRSLRFETRGPDAAEAYWGGIALLGDETRAAPNVILISLDTLSASYLSAFGDVPGVSPQIDAFLADGFSFRRALAQYGNTLVSHTSLFSGLYPRHHALYPHNAFIGFESLVRNLAEAGYLTAAFTEGAYVAASWGFGRGFDTYDDGIRGLSRQMRGGATRTFERAGRWLQRHAASSRFFLFVHTYEVHVPYVVEEATGWELVDRVTPGDARPLSDSFQTQGTFSHNAGRQPFSAQDLAHLRALHLAEIHRLDAVVGGFLERIASLGLEDETLVVLTSDHGDQFGEHGHVGHGNSLHNRVLHVPLAFRWPGRIPVGASDAPVQLVDVLPTLLDWLDLPIPDGLDGRSLAALMRGEAVPDRPAFSEMLSAPGACQRLDLPEDCRVDRYAVQTRRFKLISSRVPRYEELYDLSHDPLETRDVAAQHPEVLAEHRQLLERYLAAPEARPGEGEAASIDTQTRQQLKELGYLR